MRTPSGPDSLPVPAPEALALSARLRARIASEIAANSGWISFERYQTRALYEPGLGYYAGPLHKIGTHGDFTTAPELTPLFGQTLAKQIAQVLSVTGGDVIELGGGTGALARTILSELDRLNTLPSRYLLLDVSGELRERQRDTLSTLPNVLRDRVVAITELPQRITGIVIANEVLDAIPVRLVLRASDAIHERGVALVEGELAFADRSLDDASLAAVVRDRLPASPSPYLSEMSPQAEALAATVAERLERGVAIWIDYGFSRREFYHPQRAMGTLMCHYQHRAHPDALFHPGLQDITTHVDFTAIAEASAAAGAQVMGYTTQAAFLMNLGIGERLLQAQAPGSVEYMKSASALQRLVSPAEMGELFKVLAVGRGVDVPLAGFQGLRGLAL